MPIGSPRPNAGRKPIHVEHALMLRETQPLRYEILRQAGDLDALEVMRENMHFFHIRAAEVLATIMATPLGADSPPDQLALMKDWAGIVKCRELAQACARDLARYTHSPMAPKPATPQPNASNPAAIQHIPTPKAVSDAFAKAAEGLPPEPRKRL